ncbi:hypothetical protein BH11MYX1_BH11MYX1_01990 [soil metagenome]
MRPAEVIDANHASDHPVAHGRRDLHRRATAALTAARSTARDGAHRADSGRSPGVCARRHQSLLDGGTVIAEHARSWSRRQIIEVAEHRAGRRAQSRTRPQGSRSTSCGRSDVRPYRRAPGLLWIRSRSPSHASGQAPRPLRRPRVRRRRHRPPGAKLADVGALAIACEHRRKGNRRLVPSSSCLVTTSTMPTSVRTTSSPTMSDTADDLTSRLRQLGFRARRDAIAAFLAHVHKSCGCPTETVEHLVALEAHSAA